MKEELTSPVGVIQAEASRPPYEWLARAEEVRRLKVPAEILEVAAEIADDSDVIGIETTRLEFLLRAVLFLDRRSRRTP